jgi:nucleotide-binding universal stress UspA family protein
VNVKTVIYATDLSVYCRNAGQYAAFLARHFSAQLLIVHVFTLSQAAMEVEMDPVLISEQRKDLEFLLARKAERMRGGGIAADYVLLEGDPRSVLPELTEKLAPCLLMLGTHGGGWVERELIGSVAETVLRSTTCPVITVGPQVKGWYQGFRHVLYAGDSPAEAAWYAESLAREFGAEIEKIPAAGQDKILQQIHDDSVDLLALGGKRTSGISGAYGLIVSAPCPVLTLLSQDLLTI